MRSKFKVTTWVQHSVDSHPFGSMLIGPPIPEIQHFQTLTLKIQGQGHSSRSQRRYTTLSIHIPFVPCGSGIPFLSYDFFENLTLKIKGQGHGWGQVQSGSNILSIHIPFVPCQSALPFLRYSIFKIWPWKSRVKVMGEVTVQSHNVGLTSYRLTSLSFHVKRPSQSWVTTFFKIWPWKSRVKVMGGVTVQSHNVGLTSYRFTSFSFHVNRPSHSWDTVFSKFDLENQGSRSNDHGVAQLQV